MMLNDQRRKELAELHRDRLLDNVLPFWLKHAIDQQFGGINTSLDQDGTVIDTDKSVWQQCRFTWLLGELVNHHLLADHADRDRWLMLAHRNLEFISRYCFDSEDGRMWFHVTSDGKPVRKRRYAYTESFAAIAFGEMAKATANEGFAEQAESCFQRFLDHNLVPEGYPDAATPKFTESRRSKSIGFPMILINTAAQLRDSIQLDDATAWIDQGIDEIRQDFCKPDIKCVMETVGPKGEVLDHFDGRTLNPGHAVEGAWFILNEAIHRDNDSDLIELGCQMLDWMWHRGWDNEFGGLLYFVSVDDRPIQEYWQDMKFWWPHNELIIATLMAFQLTGDEKYSAWHQLAHDWAFQNFPDPKHGEWFGYLRRDGAIVTRLKGNLWKGPFHLPRMHLKCWELMERPFRTE